MGARLRRARFWLLLPAVVAVIAAAWVQVGPVALVPPYDDQLVRIAHLQERLGWLTPAMSAVTFLGDEELYLLLLPIIYWAVNRRIGIRLGVMLLLTAGVNSLLKLGFATPRPAYLDPGLELAREHSFGMPSGHAQNAAAIWGVLAASLRDWRVRIGLVAMVLAIGWSRIQLGAHFLEDVVVGWLVGLLLVVLYLWIAPRGARWVRRLRMWEQILAAVAASLLPIGLAVVLSGRLSNVDFPWPGVVEADRLVGASSVVTAAATLAGFGIGLAVLHARGGFDHRGPVDRRLLRVLVGLVGVVVLWQGLGMLFPGGEDPLALLWRYLRYGLVGLWVGGLAPLLFRRLGVAEPLPGVSPSAESLPTALPSAEPGDTQQDPEWPARRRTG